MKYKVHTAKLSEMQNAQLNNGGWGFSPWSKAYANLRFISEDTAIGAAADIFEMFTNGLYHLGYEFEIDSQSIQPHLEMIFAAGNAQRPVLPAGALLSFIKHPKTPSISVGDIVQADDGSCYICCNHSWEKLPRKITSFINWDQENRNGCQTWWDWLVQDKKLKADFEALMFETLMDEQPEGRAV